MNADMKKTHILPLLLLFSCKTFSVAQPLPGSPEWIECFIDRQGGCLTLLNVLPTLKNGTVPGMACPGCGNSSNDRFFQGTLVWNPEKPDELFCQKCHVTVSSENFPDSGKMQFDGLDFEYYDGHAGKRYFWRPQLRYIKSLHAFYTAQTLAREAKRLRRLESGRQALAILIAYSRYYRHYICNLSHNTLYRPGYPRQCNWGRLTHFGDYVFPKKFCQTYQDLEAAKIPISPEERAEVRALLESIISEVTLPFIRQVNGMGNPMGAAYADCIWAARTFPEAKFPDYCNASGDTVPVLDSPGLIREILEGPNGFQQLMSNYFYADGLMRERTTAYQEMLVRGLRNTATAIKGYRMPDSSDPPFDLLAEPGVQRNFSAHKAIHFPDGRSIPIGDDYGDVVTDTPQATSALYAGWGIGMLCKGTNEHRSCTVLNWGSGLDGHSHNDMLSLLFWSEGQLMLSPPEYPAHRDGAIREEYWRGGAAAHNTVIVDGTEHVRSRGNPLLWIDLPGIGIVRAESRLASPGNHLIRTVFLLDTGKSCAPYLVDFFNVSGGSIHTLFFQAQGEKYQPRERLEILAPSLTPSSYATFAEMFASPMAPALQYLLAPRTALIQNKAELLWHFRSGEHNRMLRAVFLPDGEEKLICTEAPGVRNRKEADQKRTVEKIIRQREGDSPGLNSCFVSLFEATSGAVASTPLQIQRLQTTGSAGAAAIRVIHATGEDLILSNPASKPVTITVGSGIQLCFDGTALVLRIPSYGKNAELTTVGGTSCTIGKEEPLACSGPYTGILTTSPTGLNSNLNQERNATITVNMTLPATCKNKVIFISQTNGFISAWHITALRPAPGGGTELELDRPARNAILNITPPTPASRRLYNRSVANVLPGDSCLIHGEWRRVTKIIRPESGSAFSPWPDEKIYQRSPGGFELLLDQPIPSIPEKSSLNIPVSEIARGDQFRIETARTRLLPVSNLWRTR